MDESAHDLISRAQAAPPPRRHTGAGRLAWALSVVLHPLLLPSYLFALLFWLSPALLGVSNADIRYRILLLLVVATFVIPMLSTYMLYRLGSIRSLAMHDRQDRVFPFIATTLFYGLTTYLFAKQLSALYLLTVILGGITACLLLLTLISFFWKISAHSVGIAGIVGILVGLYHQQAAAEYFYPLLLSILLAGGLLSARLYLDAHTPAQVLAGAMAGFGIGFGSIVLFG